MSCSSKLNAWVNLKGCSMPFAVPMIWRELKNHRHFCMAPPIQKGIIMKKEWTEEYPNTPTVIRPVPFCEGLLIPEPMTVFPLTVMMGGKKNPPSAIYFKRSGIFPERNLCWSTLDHAEKTFWPHQRPRTVKSIKQNCCCQDFKSGIFRTTLWKWQHFTPVKKILSNSS